MNELRKVYISFQFGRWIGRVAADAGIYEWPDLGRLIAVLQRIYRTETLLFIVNRSTIKGSAAAETEFLKASEKGGALMISSVQEF